MNVVPGKTRREGALDGNRRRAFHSAHLPAAIEVAARGQFDRVPRAHLHLVRLTHQVQHVRHQVRSCFEHDVARVAQHPDVEGPDRGLRKKAIPGDRDLVDASQDAAADVASQLLPGPRKQEVVPHAETHTACGSLSDEFLAQRPAVAHGFFEEHTHAGFDHRAGRRKMQVGRQQNVDGVEFFRLQHDLERCVALCDPVSRGQGLGALLRVVAYGNQFHARHGLETFRVPVGDVAGSQQSYAGMRRGTRFAVCAFLFRLEVGRLAHGFPNLYSMIVMGRRRIRRQ